MTLSRWRTPQDDGGGGIEYVNHHDPDADYERIRQMEVDEQADRERKEQHKDA